VVAVVVRAVVAVAVAVTENLLLNQFLLVLHTP